MQRILLFIMLVVLVGCKKFEDTTPAPAPTIESVTPIGDNIDASAAVYASTSGLPKHVAFGIEGDVSQSAQVIKEAEYQYVYLAGDIFSNGWTTWNYPSGQYARNFLNQMGQNGKIPVFTYYNIVPGRYRFQEPATINLNDAELMNKYFNDWKFLLQLCKSYGKTVIIHYEPDLFGYMQMFKNDASKQTIKVSQSGQADVKVFTNDAKGLAQAIVSMRNKYAPNVVLGWHASQWSTGYDVIKDQHNPEEHATATAAYYKSLNAPFDLIFSEFSDRDAGYYQVLYGRTNSFWSTQADASNGNASDYDRFQRYLKKINQLTGRKIILWQIPMGNTLTKTCNNTSSHYKDNRAEYFLNPVFKSGDKTRVNQYAQAGVIAFLFGWGANDCTTYMDLKQDGITGVNELADDDGGYLRTTIKSYYQRGPVLIN